MAPIAADRARDAHPGLMGFPRYRSDAALLRGLAQPRRVTRVRRHPGASLVAKVTDRLTAPSEPRDRVLAHTAYKAPRACFNGGSHLTAASASASSTWTGSRGEEQAQVHGERRGGLDLRGAVRSWLLGDDLPSTARRPGARLGQDRRGDGPYGNRIMLMSAPSSRTSPTRCAGRQDPQGARRDEGAPPRAAGAAPGHNHFIRPRSSRGQPSHFAISTSGRGRPTWNLVVSTSRVRSSPFIAPGRGWLRTTPSR
jgi:hypothetical protein